MATKNKPRRQVNFRMDDNTYKALTDIAKTKSMTKTDVVVGLIHKALRRQSTL